MFTQKYHTDCRKKLRSSGKYASMCDYCQNGVFPGFDIKIEKDSDNSAKVTFYEWVDVDGGAFSKKIKTGEYKFS